MDLNVVAKLGEFDLVVAALRERKFARPTTKSKRLLGLSHSTSLIAFTLVMINRDRRVVAHLLAKKPVFFLDEFVCLAQNGIEGLFEPL